MLKRLLSHTLLPLSVAGSLGALLVARAAGVPLEAVVLAASVAVLGIGVVLERLMPFRRAWNLSHGDTATDLTSAALLLGAVDPLLKAFIPVLAVAMAAALPTLAGPSLFPTQAPFAVQVLLALLWMEFAKYWAHRWHHTDRALWWLHAMHHSSRRLYALNGFRFHPLNHAINQTASVLPLLLIGAPAEVLLACLAITQPVLMLQHANIDLRHGWLNAVFSTNEAHRWHHSGDAAEADANFGSALLLWDHVFGTYRAAVVDRAPAAIGLFADAGRYPSQQNYGRQLASMFSAGCCRA